MNSKRKVVGAALAVFAVIAMAQSPYEINGLHTDLAFTEAVAIAEKQHGNCQFSESKRRDGKRIARCEYLPCSKRNQAGTCEKWETNASGPTFASQPILWVSLEAPGDAARLTRIAFSYAGSSIAVEDSLRKEFGPANSDGTPVKENTWSQAHRLGWTRGSNHIGLLASPKLIFLTADPVEQVGDASLN
jgi:hypothetical protein